MKDARNAPQTNLRMPLDLKEWLQKKAVGNYRSLTNEIITRLEASRKQEEEIAKAA